MTAVFFVVIVVVGSSVLRTFSSFVIVGRGVLWTFLSSLLIGKERVFNFLPSVRGKRSVLWTVHVMLEGHFENFLLVHVRSVLATFCLPFFL